MVEIQEVTEDPGPSITSEDANDNNDDAKDTGGGHEDKDEDGWMKLMGDDLIMKIIETKDPLSKSVDGRNDVQPQDAVLIDFVGRIASDKSVTDGPIFQQVKSWLIVIGEGDVLPAIEMACRFMEAGQTSYVWSHSKYAMGPGTRSSQDGTTKVPSRSNVMYQLTVVQKVMDTSRLNPYFTIQKALTKKNIANDIYQFEWCPPSKEADDPDCSSAMSRAIRLYQKSAKEMETLLDGTYFQQVEADHPQRGQSQQILLDSLNNIVAVYMRQKEYHKAKQSAVEVLRQDPKNMKGLLRAAKSSLLDPASTLEEVKAALDAAESEITYKNPNEEKELKRLKADFKKNQNEYKERTKAMFKDKLKTNTLGEKDQKIKNADGAAASASAADDDNIAGGTARRKSSPEPTATGESPTEGEENEKSTTVDDATFWKSQIFTMIFQIVLPAALFWLFQLVRKTERIAEATMSRDDILVEVDEERGDETINLDL